MPTLPTDLRNKLERVVIDARDAAEAGARDALESLAVHHHEPYPHMKPAQRELRNHLRARARQLGDKQDKAGRLTIDHLVHECAYEHWHRMLFARFLAENNLLIEPDENMAISLAEAEELAKDQGLDVWAYASRCAQRMLPQIFRPDDPLLQVTFATEHMLKLEKLLASLPAAVFTASDALGWVYQFWQSKKKDEVNRSEVKIGADELPAVTQLFTEPYMVEFLYHNTLGAWWAGKKLTAEDAENAETEEELRKKLALPGVTWDYLRFVRGADGKGGPWRPAAGTFDGWPKAARDIKVLDPCCGSGHFLVAGLHLLTAIRMAEEGLTTAQAVDAVLRDNLHGLEIDERCCQIAAFALAFEAWKMGDFTAEDAEGRGGGPRYRELPPLHIACTGIGPQCSADQWIKLAEQSGIPMPSVGREAIRNGLLNLHRLFSLAPTLGSLINPKDLPADLIAADYETIQPYLTAIRAVEKADDETRERAIAAAGMVKAADLLAGDYTLVITNVPYLGRGKQADSLKAHIEEHFNDGKADLATAFEMRCLDFCLDKGSVAIVMPWGWTFAAAYRQLRERILKTRTLNILPKLGEGGFGSTAAAGAFVVAPVITRAKAPADHVFAAVDASIAQTREAKAGVLGGGSLVLLHQRRQLENPDARILFEDTTGIELLSTRAKSFQGIKTGDDGFGKRFWWEFPRKNEKWKWLQSTVDKTIEYGGCEYVLRWENNGAGIARLQGQGAWGKAGIAVSLMRELRSSIYTGEIFDSNVSALVVDDANQVCPLWAFCSDRGFNAEVRKIDPEIKVETGSVSKVPFDLAQWQKVAAKKYPDGLPEPESDDPTQWLFHGRPDEAQEGTELQVAVARLLGYRWPAELDDKMRLSKRARALVAKCGELANFADNDGIVGIPAVRGEERAAERLRRLLAAAYGEAWSAEREQKLIRATGSTAADLDEWLRNDFFAQHCKLFHDRPFIWHIWDGRKRDGFHALVNYHKLCGAGSTAAGAEGHRDKHPETPPRSSASSAVTSAGRRLLESLTYAYLGEWITRQRDGVKRGEGGAEDRLAAALELQKRLEAILAGEPPFDIFVRWKPLAQQPIGWEPDINDGVRVNIRPLLASDLPKGPKGAGILRCKPNIKWGKDRGKEPQRPKEEYPWFWGWDEKTVDFAGGKTFDGNRWNACHYTNKVKQSARDAAGKGKQ